MNRFIHETKSLFLQPFPDKDDAVSIIKESFVLGLFVTFFLYVLTPFGLARIQHGIFLICALFGLVTFAISFLYDVFISHILQISREAEDWTFLKWTVSSLVVIFLIAVGNFLLYLHIAEEDISIDAFKTLLYNTYAIGIFPIFFFGYIKLTRSRQHFQSISEAIILPETQSIDDVEWSISSASGKVILLTKTNFIFAKAMQNYVVFHLHKDGNINKEVLRISLSQVEEQVDGDVLVRCHRSYIVNQSMITKISGNAQGLKLYLKDVSEFVIPVSRKYISLFQYRESPGDVPRSS